MQDGNAVEEKVKKSLKPWRVVSSPLLEVFKQRLDGYLSSESYRSDLGYRKIRGKAEYKGRQIWFLGYMLRKFQGEPLKPDNVLAFCQASFLMTLSRSGFLTLAPGSCSDDKIDQCMV